MRKRQTAALLAAAMLIMAFSGCGCEHKAVIDEGYPATCTENGLSDGEHCTLCGKVLKKQEIIESPGHLEERLPEVEPTCTEPRLSWGKVCSFCGEILVPQEQTAEPLGHDFVDGICTRCGERLPVWIEVPKTNEFGDLTGEFLILNNFGFDIGHHYYEAYIAIDGRDSVQLSFAHIGAVTGITSMYLLSDTFKVLIRQGGGEAAKLSGWGYGDFIDFPFEEDRELLLEYLCGSETIELYVEGLQYPDEHHLFSFEPDNFAELYGEG